MLAGELPFRAPSAPETLSAIINAPLPPLPGDLADVPDGSVLGRIVEKCLAKEPDERYQTAKDLAVDLRWAARRSDSAGSAPREKALATKSHRRRFLWAVAIAAGLAGVAALFFVRSPAPSVPRLANARQITSVVGVEEYPTWSPDGSRIAYHTNQGGSRWSISQTLVAGGEPVRLTREPSANDRWAAWSHDGTQIAFRSDREGGGCFVVSALGGASRRVATGIGFGGAPAWSSDDTELECPNFDSSGGYAGIVSLGARSSRRVPLVAELGGLILGLSWSPDGLYFAYVNSPEPEAQASQLWITRLSDEEHFAVNDGSTDVRSPSWSDDGRTLYFVSNRGGSLDLWQQRIDGEGRPSGAPEPVTTGLEMRSASFSPDGTTLAYSRGRLIANAWRVPIFAGREATWADAEQLSFDYAYIEYIDVAPDGRHLYFSSDRSGNEDLWMMSMDGADLRQLTTDPAPDWNPKLSPDGTEVAFYSARSGNRDIWILPLDGGAPQQVTRHQALEWQPSWSPDV